MTSKVPRPSRRSSDPVPTREETPLSPVLDDPFAEPAARVVDPFAGLEGVEKDPFPPPSADPFASPVPPEVDPFAAVPAGTKDSPNLAPSVSLGSPEELDDDELLGMSGPSSDIVPDVGDGDIEIDIGEDVHVEEEPDSPPVSARSPFGQSYLRKAEEGDPNRPTVPAPPTYPGSELIRQFADDDDDD